VVWLRGEQGFEDVDCRGHVPGRQQLLGLVQLVAILVEYELSVAGAVGTRSVEHARRVTFASDNLTVMVVVNPQRDGKVRLDGWAAPGGRLHAELRVGDATLTAECDEAGRFVFDAVPAGPAQLVLHPTLDSDPSLTLPVVTPAVHL